MVVDRSIRVRVGFIHRDGIVPNRVSTELEKSSNVVVASVLTSMY